MLSSTQRPKILAALSVAAGLQAMLQGNLIGSGAQTLRRERASATMTRHIQPEAAAKSMSCRFWRSRLQGVPAAAATRKSRCGPGHMWLIRTKPQQLEGRTRHLALLYLAIDSKLRG